MNIFLWLCVCSFVTISRITLHHCRSLVWALSHAHSLPRPLLLMGMLTHLQPGCSVEMQKARLLLVLLVLCIYDCTAIYSPGNPCHRLPSNHLQFHKCWVLRKVSTGQKNSRVIRKLHSVECLVTRERDEKLLWSMVHMYGVFLSHLSHAAGGCLNSFFVKKI